MAEGRTAGDGRTTAEAGQVDIARSSAVSRPSSTVRTLFPFSAIVGQEQMKRALLLNAVNPGIGGVLIRGEKGTAKSTAARALARLLPSINAVPGCPFACGLESTLGLCTACESDEPAAPVARAAPLVTLPLGATEDRVLGTLDLERAIQEGKRHFEPGLLAAAHRGILYIDEVNLLSDHLVDVLLDTAAMGVNVVEREGVSVQHPARFMLVGTMNPEEGELRPQLLDRFGLAVEVRGVPDPTERAEIVRRRIAFEADPWGFVHYWETEEFAERERIASALARLPAVHLGERILSLITRLCADLQVDGLRADIVIYKTALAIAAYDGRDEVTDEDVREAAELALPHRRRRGPFQQPRLDPQELDDAFDRARDESSPTEASDAEQTEGGEDEHEQVFAIGAPAPVALPEPSARASAGEGRRAEIGPHSPRGAVTGVRELGQSQSRSLALGPTLRAAAPRQAERHTEGSLALQIRRDDLRVQERAAEAAALVMIVLDSSGSMGARRRMESVKGAILGLLTDAYQKRDRVGLIAFRGERAELLLPPTSSVDLAQRCLADLPTGGRTPLAHGLRLAMETLERASHAERLAPLLVLVTDGRTNVAVNGADPVAEARAMAESIAARGIPAIVVDTEDGRLRLGGAVELAQALASPCLHLDDLQSGTLKEMVQRGVSRPASQ